MAIRFVDVILWLCLYFTELVNRDLLCFSLVVNTNELVV